MRAFTIEINGKAVTAEAEPRTHLADFLREQRYLTGTHLGCEHGVCGACTVLIDGRPARSCITFALACEGAQVTTIEGLRDDPVMADLREAFSDNHGLQCGFCTPAMLVSCRDVVMRLPEADEARIRLELSGNLCRCTGYGGIVAAVKSVLQTRKAAGARPSAVHDGLGPVGARAPTARQGEQTARTPIAADTPSAAGGRPAAQIRETVTAEQWLAVETDGMELLQSFRVAHPRAQVWRFFEDIEQVARCMPGARLTGPVVDGRGDGEVNVKLGPIVGAFNGTVEVERDEADFSGRVRGAGRDPRSGSSARAIIGHRLEAVDDMATQVQISVKFLLSGPLAQFGRSGLLKDIADHLTQLFAANLEAAMSGKQAATGPDTTLDAATVARAALWRRIRALLARLAFWR